MAVTIDDMQVDVRSDPSGPQSKGAQPGAAAQQPGKQEDICQKLEMMAERALRLKAN